MENFIGLKRLNLLLFSEENMLRSIYLDNFFKFSATQTVTFGENESPYIFVGENGSGKTALIEGIKQCLKSTSSAARSAVLDKNKLALFICKYDTRKCPDLKSPWMFTGVMVDHEGVNSTYYKFVSKKYEFLIDRYESDKEGSDQTTFCQRQINKDADYFSKVLEKDIQTFITVVLGFQHGYENVPDKTKSEVDKRLQLLNKYVVFTFPSRSIGPLQWSKSIKVESDRRDNYLEAADRAEIVKYFLTHQDEFDIAAENEIFKELTERIDLKFELSTDDDKVIVLSTSEGKSLPGDDYALLNLPEGILEAKHFSILMSNRSFRTICLEEPARGMHPQMTGRMLALIQRESEKKTVILSTHNTCFVNAMTIPRLVIFKQKPQVGHDGLTSEIISGDVIAKLEIQKPQARNHHGGPSMKTLRTLTRDHLADLIFAKRVLFCEGDSDLLFLTALKEKIIKGSPGIKHVLQLITNYDILESLQKVCATLQIIPLYDWSFAELMNIVCAKLMIEEHFFVCDKYAIMEDEDNGLKVNEWMGKTYAELQKTFKPDKEESWIEVRDILKKECQCFAWRDGTIEDMVISLLRSGTAVSASEDETYDQRVSWLEKSAAIRALRHENVELPLSGWKTPSRQREDKDKKLFLPSRVTHENILKSTEVILEACDKKSDDLVQFILFLLNL